MMISTRVTFSITIILILVVEKLRVQSQQIEAETAATAVDTAATDDGELESAFSDYEPRVWSPDESSSVTIDNADDEEDFWDFSLGQNETKDTLLSQAHGKEQRNNDAEATEKRRLRCSIEEEKQSRASLRNQSHFYEPKYGIRLKANKLNTAAAAANNTRQQQQQQKCDQFRVDIQETVICDRQRCEKLDFEWPKHDNQMIVIQTTKHGMRFYQAQLEFEPLERSTSGFVLVRSPQISSDSVRRMNSFERIRKGANSSHDTKPKMPIKFDIFDLFKPKTTTTTTQKPSSSTAAATITTTQEEVETSTLATGTSSTTTSSSGDSKKEEEGSNNSSSKLDLTQENRTELVTTFMLSTRRRMQKILGFGGALSDSTCRNIKSLSPTMSKNLMDDYFGSKGIQYSLVRMTMGSSDFSLSPYTNNDKPYKKKKKRAPAEEHESMRQAVNSTTTTSPPFDDELNDDGNNGDEDDTADDLDMRYFRLTEEDYEYKLPVARQAIATSKRELKFFSSLWSPPIWMKNNSHIVHGYLKGDVYGPYYRALADLIVKWLEAYRQQGIEFWGTTGLNEPITGVRPFIFHNSLGITRDDYITWIKLYLGPMLRQRGFQNLKLMPIDDNKGYMTDWAAKLLEDKDAAKYISGISLHWYMNDDYENLNFLISKHPDKFLLSTEASNGYYPFQVHVLPGDWDRGMAYMLDIMRLMHKNVVGWVDWNMALSTSGGPSWPNNYIDAAILVNAERDEYYKSPSFYAIGHFSKFVVPDSYRLDHRLTNAKYDYPLEASGFYTPNNYVVIVVLNANKYQVPFRVIVDRKLVRVVDLKQESLNTIVFRWKK